MTIKRLLLILLTLVAISFYGQALFNSWQKPQIQSRLQLYQTNIVLQAQQWEPEDNDAENLKTARDALVGKKVLESATKQYQKVRKSAETSLQKIKQQLEQTNSDPQLQKSLEELQNLIPELDLRLGILQARQQKTEKAIQTWTQLQQNSQINPEFATTAAALEGLWSEPPRILPNSQQLIQSNLEGWFSYTTLVQLYQLQQRQDALSSLQATEKIAAEDALFKLAIVATLPALAGLLGIGLIIFLVVQRILAGKAALLAKNADLPWETPWDGETTLQVFIFGFFFIGQIVISQFLIPILVALLPIPRPVDVRLQTFLVLFSYVLVSLGTISVLYLSIKPFLPLTKDWFRFRWWSRWFLWGFGGYCVALPIVIVVSLINQQLWQGQGGSNPLLQLALQSQDTVALAILFLTAGIAAPLFEEFLFRGFLLPSLTHYLPVWGSILLTALLFAIAHLSLSEILPLFALGVVLGVVYTRSRNLLAPMLLHSLWNSGTLMSLFILGSGNN
ncbi:MAG: CPBP family glutamic-type intramembrane protease [Nostocaceae cyanobacterium]|nr:CPBP family glutamic-type intramembrane protease [Nostocaceae cyanobacterium]